MKAVYGFLSSIVFMGFGPGARGEDNTNLFLQDIITTFRLTSPTIVYNKHEEAPDICYSAEWVLCLQDLTSWYREDHAKKLGNSSTNNLLNYSEQMVTNSTGDVKCISTYQNTTEPK